MAEASESPVGERKRYKTDVSPDFRPGRILLAFEPLATGGGPWDEVQANRVGGSGVI